VNAATNEPTPIDALKDRISRRVRVLEFLWRHQADKGEAEALDLMAQHSETALLAMAAALRRSDGAVPDGDAAKDDANAPEDEDNAGKASELLGESAAALAEARARIAELETALRERDKRIGELNRMVRSLQDAVKRRDARIVELESPYGAKPSELARASSEAPGQAIAAEISAPVTRRVRKAKGPSFAEWYATPDEACTGA
jgi:hypothetical protein